MQPARQKKITFIVPCYNEEENVKNTHFELSRVAKNLGPKYDYEIIFVNNGSEDRTEDLIRGIAKRDRKVTGVFLSRNFGPEASGLAGQHYATGDAVMWIEADLQDPVEKIPEFVKKWEDGYDVVLGRRDKSHEGWFIRTLREKFYTTLKKIAYINIPPNVGAFSLFDKKVNVAMNSLCEKNRFGRGIRAWVGFKTAEIPYMRRERRFGKTSYNNILDYMRHAEKGIIGFSNLPLEILTYIGVSLVSVAIIAIIVYLMLFFTFGNPITASATLFLATLFFGSINILAVSIIGKYLAIIFEETKNRPHYIVKDTINCKKMDESS